MEKKKYGCSLCMNIPTPVTYDVFSAYDDHKDLRSTLCIENENGYNYLYHSYDESNERKKIAELYYCPMCGRNLNQEWMGRHRIQIDFKDLTPEKQEEFKQADRFVNWENARLATADFGYNQDAAVYMFEIVDTSYLP